MTMRARISQIACASGDPRMSFKTNIVRGLVGRSVKTHLIDKDGDRNLVISASSIYPTMFQKTNVVRSF